MLAELAKKDGKVYNQLDEADKAKYKVLLQKELRKNTYDAQTGIITFSKMRAKVAKQLHNYYAKLFLMIHLWLNCAMRMLCAINL